MSLATYADLQAAVLSWLARPDLAGVVPDIIRLGEERLQRALRVQPMEALMAPATIVNGAIAAPAGAVALKTVWITGYELSPLKPQTYEALLAMGNNTTPTHYAWAGGSIYFDGAGQVNAIVYQQLPALASSGSNWLLAQHPSAYLMAALVEASLFTGNDARAPLWEQKLQTVLSEITGNDQRDSLAGPLVASAR